MNTSQNTVIPVHGRLNDYPNDFDRLFDMSHTVRTSSYDIVFDFNNCHFLAQNAIAFIGGLTTLAQNKGNQVYYLLEGMSSQVRQHIDKNGFLNAFKIGSNNRVIKDTAVPFRIDTTIDTNDFAFYLRELWLNELRIDLDPLLKDVIVSTILEVYINVFDHASSPVGVTSCGQHFPNNRDLDITLVDFGVGIPHNVRTFLNKPNIKASEALRWAFQPGNTTKKGVISRGLGLKQLKQFIQQNNGKLEIYSENGYIKVDRSGEQIIDRQKTFGGTVIQVTLKCDQHHYSLEEVLKQSDDSPLF
ncbi:MAG: ATP-binding protein [bacterium]|nr:ATP-binding protein [bacterium]